MGLFGAIKRYFKAIDDARTEREAARAAREERIRLLRESTERSKERTRQFQVELDEINGRAERSLVNGGAQAHAQASNAAVAAAQARMSQAILDGGYGHLVGTGGSVSLYAGNSISSTGVTGVTVVGSRGEQPSRELVLGQFPPEQPAVVPHLLASMTLAEVDGFIEAIEREIEGGGSEPMRRMLALASERRLLLLRTPASFTFYDEAVEIPEEVWTQLGVAFRRK